MENSTVGVITVRKKVVKHDRTSVCGIIAEYNNKLYYVPKENFRDFSYSNATIGKSGCIYVNKLTMPARRYDWSVAIKGISLDEFPVLTRKSVV